MKIGLLGAGLMGSTFAQRLAKQGFNISVYNRTLTKITALADQGIKISDSVDEIIAGSDTLVLMLSDAEAIRSVLLPDHANLDLTGKTIIQMATIAPEQSRQLHQDFSNLNGKYIEAPVLGSTPEAEAGKLIIMAGCDGSLFTEILPILNALSESPQLVGEVGTAAALKLSMNQLIASLTSAFSLSLGFALNNNVDLDAFMETVRASALYAPTYDKKLSKYLDRSFAGANFSTKHLLKDINLFLLDAKKLGLATQALEGVGEITKIAVDQGLGNQDYSSIYQIINPEDAE